MFTHIKFQFRNDSFNYYCVNILFQELSRQMWISVILRSYIFNKIFIPMHAEPWFYMGPARGEVALRHVCPKDSDFLYLAKGFNKTLKWCAMFIQMLAKKQTKMGTLFMLGKKILIKSRWKRKVVWQNNQVATQLTRRCLSSKPVFVHVKRELEFHLIQKSLWYWAVKDQS